MSLREQIRADITAAMKAKQMDKLNALRMIQSALKNREIELRPNEMPEEECLAVIRKLVKQRKESIEQFTAGNRMDLVANESKELALIETYLPAQLSRAQIETIVANAIVKTGAKTAKEMGMVMKEVQSQTKGMADNKTVSELVKSKLQ